MAFILNLRTLCVYFIVLTCALAYVYAECRRRCRERNSQNPCPAGFACLADDLGIKRCYEQPTTTTTQQTATAEPDCCIL